MMISKMRGNTPTTRAYVKNDIGRSDVTPFLRKELYITSPADQCNSAVIGAPATASINSCGGNGIKGLSALPPIIHNSPFG